MKINHPDPHNFFKNAKHGLMFSTNRNSEML